MIHQSRVSNLVALVFTSYATRPLLSCKVLKGARFTGTASSFVRPTSSDDRPWLLFRGLQNAWKSNPVV